MHARVGHDERVDLRDQLVGRRDRFGDVVITCGNATQAQPLVSRHQAFDVRRSDDLEVILVRERADHLGVLVHDEGGEVELTVPDKRRLRFEIVIGRLQAEAAEVGILQQLLHQIGRARTFRTDPDRSALEVVESVDCASAPGKQEQRFRLRQPPQGLQPGVGRRRHAILHESEGGNASPIFADETGDVFNRSRGGDNLQMAVLLKRPRRQPVA